MSESIVKFIEAHLSSNDAKRVAVYGDLMMDLYEQVRVNRLSPEFPIPVIDCAGGNASLIARPGGAGNVCEQLRHFRSHAHLFSFIDGYTSNYFHNNDHNFDTYTCYQCPCHVPIKRRFYDEDFPLCRMDAELPHYGLYHPADERKTLLSKFCKFADDKKIDVVIISDYNKGVFDQQTAGKLISACKDRQIISIVDPKKHPNQWTGCSIFKPNLAEAADFLRVSTGEFVCSWKQYMLELKELVKCDKVIITNGGKGVFGIEGNKHFEYVPKTVLQDVRSVIGAGDCFAAVLALAVAQNNSLYEAVEIAYEAATVYVQKKHNEPVWPHELLRRVEPTAAKIITPSEMGRICGEYHRKKTVIFTNGCFDFLHKGHLSTLEFAKKQCGPLGLLVVALNSDESVKKLKGPGRPINTLADRLYLIAGMECVDFVTHFDEDTPAELIAKLKPEIVVKGGDYAIEDVVGNTICKVIIAPTCKGLSTSNIIEKVRKL